MLPGHNVNLIMPLDQSALALVKYLRTQESRFGYINTPYGPILVAFDYVIDPLLAAVESDLKAMGAHTIKITASTPEIKPVPVTASANMSGKRTQ